MTKKGWGVWFSRLGFPVVLVLFLIPVFLNFDALVLAFQNPEIVRGWVLSWGIWAPFVFIGLQFAQVVVFVIPGEIVQVSGGYLFGFWLGSLYSSIGIALGSLFAFLVSRTLGVNFVHALLGPEQVKRFDHFRTSPKLVGTFFLLFLVPGLPKDILCYLAGISRMKVLPFLVLTTVARVPGIFISSLLGHSFLDGNWVLLSVTIAVTAACVVLCWIFRERLLKILARFAIQSETTD